MFIIKYKSKTNEEWKYLPSYCYETETEAQDMCNKFNSCSDFFNHVVEKI